MSETEQKDKPKRARGPMTGPIRSLSKTVRASAVEEVDELLVSVRQEFNEVVAKYGRLLLGRGGAEPVPDTIAVALKSALNGSAEAKNTLRRSVEERIVDTMLQGSRIATAKQVLADGVKAK